MKTVTLNIDLLESDESLAVIQGIIAPETRLVSQIVDEQPRKKTLPILPAGYRYPARDAEVGQELRRKNIIVQSDETFEPHTGDILINHADIVFRVTQDERRFAAELYMNNIEEDVDRAVILYVTPTAANRSVRLLEASEIRQHGDLIDGVVMDPPVVPDKNDRTVRVHKSFTGVVVMRVGQVYTFQYYSEKNHKVRLLKLSFDGENINRTLEDKVHEDRRPPRHERKPQQPRSVQPRAARVGSFGQEMLATMYGYPPKRGKPSRRDREMKHRRRDAWDED